MNTCLKGCVNLRVEFTRHGKPPSCHVSQPLALYKWRDMKYLACHVTLKNPMIEELINFMSERSS